MEQIIEILKTVDFSNVAWQVLAPLIFSVADFVTGFIQAVINKNVDSQKMREGLWHKTLLLIIILLGFTLDFTFNLRFVSKSICIFIIAMEIVSIGENIKKAGIDLGRLGDILKEKSDSNLTENVSNLIKKVEIVAEENKKGENEDNE